MEDIKIDVPRDYLEKVFSSIISDSKNAIKYIGEDNKLASISYLNSAISLVDNLKLLTLVDNALDKQMISEPLEMFQLFKDELLDCCATNHSYREAFDLFHVFLESCTDILRYLD